MPAKNYKLISYFFYFTRFSHVWYIIFIEYNYKLLFLIYLNIIATRCSSDIRSLIMKKSISLILLLLISLPISCKKEKPEASQLIVQSTIGNVTVQSATVKRVPLVGDVIKEGEMIVTKDRSVIDIQYGTQGVLRISENSRVTIAVLLSSEAGDQTNLTMDEGKLFVTISKLRKNSKFEVSTKTSVAAVRGTTFRVVARAKSSKIDVLSGRIRVNPVKDGKVIEGVEKVVETNRTVVLDEKIVEEIVEKKKEIEVATLKPEDVDEIREEVKDITVSEKVAEEVKKEIKEVVLEEKVDEEAKLEKEREAEAAKRRLEADRLKREKLERERLEQEQAERERSERERAEQERIAKEKKEQETKEQRVRNIPNL